MSEPKQPKHRPVAHPDGSVYVPEHYAVLVEECAARGVKVDHVRYLDIGDNEVGALTEGGHFTSIDQVRGLDKGLFAILEESIAATRVRFGFTPRAKRMARHPLAGPIAGADDKTRLDWLDQDVNAIDRIRGAMIRSEHETFREAIDADMAMMAGEES